MHIQFIALSGPHGLLLLIAFILAVLAAIPVPSKVGFWPWSWVFFLAAMLFG